MRLQWPLLLLLGFSWLSCYPKVEGIKCYVCNMEKCAWLGERKPVEAYLVDCDPKAIGCASFTAKTKDPYSQESTRNDKDHEQFFQRTCLFPGDATCFDFDPQAIHSSGKMWSTSTYSTNSFSDKIKCANTNRRTNSLPEMKEPPLDSLIWKEYSDIKVEACQHNDSCNSWDGEARPRVPIALAEGFPESEHENRKSQRSCYSCSSEFVYDRSPKGCELRYKQETKSATEVYGCTMLAIYQIAGGFKNNPHHYFERDLWYPGNQWCLQRKFDSSTERSVGKARKANIRYYKGNQAEPCGKRKDYLRTLNDQTFQHNWVGQREFNSAEEFTNFVNCRQHVKNKYKMEKGLLEYDYNETAAAEAWDGKSGVFAWVGFRFCDSPDYCNDWTEAELYDKMTNPPITSTTLQPDGSTTSTTAPTIGKDDEDDDDCYKERNKAPTLYIGLLLNGVLHYALLRMVSYALFQ